MTSKEREKAAEQTGSRLKYLNRALCLLLAAAACLLGIRLSAMRILPAGYMAAYITAMPAVCVLSGFLGEKKALTPFTALISALGICGLSFIFVRAGRLDDTLQRVASGAGQATGEMAVAVAAAADGPAENLAELSGSRIGLLRNDESAMEVKAAIDEAVVSPADYEEYTDIPALADALLNGTEKAVILDSAYIGILSEQDGYENFSEKIKIIYTMEVNAPAAETGTWTEKRTENHTENRRGTEGNDERNHTAGEGGNSGEDADTDKSGRNGNAFVVYISGIDTFGSINIKSRSDVNILMALNVETGRMQLVSTPRDYYVTLPDRGPDKLTHAGLYGVECSREVLEELYGIPIDYYIRVNFSGFKDIIDLLGGIDVYSEYDFSVEPVRHYTAGYNHLTGTEALAFARERYSFAEGDVQRGANQMEVIKAVSARLISSDMLANYEKILEEVSECVQTDMPPEAVYGLVRNQLSRGLSWEIAGYTVKGRGSREPTYSIPGATSCVMYPDEEDVAEAGRLMEEVLSADT